MALACVGAIHADTLAGSFAMSRVVEVGSRARVRPWGVLPWWRPEAAVQAVEEERRDHTAKRRS